MDFLRLNPALLGCSSFFCTTSRFKLIALQFRPTCIPPEIFLRFNQDQWADCAFLFSFVHLFCSRGIYFWMQTIYPLREGGSNWTFAHQKIYVSNLQFFACETVVASLCKQFQCFKFVKECQPLRLASFLGDYRWNCWVFYQNICFHKLAQPQLLNSHCCLFISRTHASKKPS